MLNLLLINDDLTPMDFVVDVLQELFEKSHDEAIKIMLDAHRDGQAGCGAYSDAQARDLLSEATLLARDAGYPLSFSLTETGSPG
jgi:ATP-dependent Clp protease adaptor protein ClpS